MITYPGLADDASLAKRKAGIVSMKGLCMLDRLRDLAIVSLATGTFPRLKDLAEEALGVNEARVAATRSERERCARLCRQVERDARLVNSEASLGIEIGASECASRIMGEYQPGE